MLASCADHLDVIEYLRSQSASWEARPLEVLYSAADGEPFPITEWIINDSCKVGVIYLHVLQRRQHCPKCEEVNLLHSC